jgi:hypothetical protein
VRGLGKKDTITQVADSTVETQSLGEMETRLKQLTPEGIMKAVTEGGAAFDDLVKERTKLLAGVASGRKQANAGKINDIKTMLGKNIADSIAGLKVEELIGEPITRLIWQVDGDGDPTVLINAKRVSSGAASASGQKGRHSKFRYTVGEDTFDPKAFIAKYANDSERQHSHFEKWPTKMASNVASRLQSEGSAVTISEE